MPCPGAGGIIGPIAASEQNLERTREAYAAWNRRDFEAVLEQVDPEIEWTFAGGAQFPGTDSTYRGHEGVREFWQTFIEPWEQMTIEIEELRSVGENIVALVRFRAVGAGSGLEIDTPFAHALTFRDGRVVRFEAFTDPDAAVAAAARGE